MKFFSDLLEKLNNNLNKNQKIFLGSLAASIAAFGYFAKKSGLFHKTVIEEKNIED